MTQLQSRIGFVRLPTANPGVPFRVSLPPDSRILDVESQDGRHFLHFLYCPSSTRVTRLASGGALFSPSETHTFLWCIPGVTYEGGVGVYLKAFGREHLFDLTEYDLQTGKIIR